ncbi:MAG: hypothetical protein NUV84_02770 [Candidatus Uhrbacteria bacterium]|nr:hypothetical protein [Candidatus Uhrbacteria bacterium]
MSRKPLNIQELLEIVGSQELPGDVEHRYELRRSLLCSRFFEHRVSRWERMMGYTAPLVAGGMMVGVFALMAANVSIEPEIGPQTVSSSTLVAQTPSMPVDVTPIRVEDFLSPASEPTVALAGFESAQEVRVHYIPLASHQYVRTQ